MKNVLDLGIVADGQTPYTHAIQYLLNANDDIIYIPNTPLPIVTGPLTIPGNTRLIIDGYLKLAPLSNSHLLTLGGSNIHISGLGVLDGNRSGQQQWTGVPGNSAPAFSAGIFYGSLQPLPSLNKAGPPITNITIEGLTITETENWPISLGNVTNSRLRNIKAFSCGNSLQFTAGCLACVADGLTITQLDDIAFAFYGGTNGCSIINSYIYNNPDNGGISVLMDDGSPYPCGTTLIANNWVQSCKVGIWVGKNDSFNINYDHECVTITGNQCWGNKMEGIYVAKTAGGVVANNLCTPGNGLPLVIDPTAVNIMQNGNIVQ